MGGGAADGQTVNMVHLFAWRQRPGHLLGTYCVPPRIIIYHPSWRIQMIIHLEIDKLRLCRPMILTYIGTIKGLLDRGGCAFKTCNA